MRRTPQAALVCIALTLCCAVGLARAGSLGATTSLDVAADRAVELQKSIESEQELLTALDERVKAMEVRLFRKKVDLSGARARADAAAFRYRDRMVTMYKTGDLGAVELLVEATSLRDLFYRSTLISRLADLDREELVSARAARSDAEYAASIVAEMKSELADMKSERRKHLVTLEASLATQKELVRRLSAEARARVSRVSSDSRISRDEWSRTSLPKGASVGLAKATVSPYEFTYLVTAHQPKRYRSAGGKYTAVCSWYGNEFHGRRTASGQIFNQNDFTCASRSLPFGTRLALSRGSKRIVVVVTDRGPFVAGRDLDLSRAAARSLGIGGVAAVTAERVTVVY